MSADPASAAATVGQSTVYDLCSAHSAAAFKKDPARYVGATA